MAHRTPDIETNTHYGIRIKSEALADALTQIARDRGLVWENSGYRRGHVRSFQLFKHLIETHPEVQEMLETLGYEDEEL